MFYSLKGKLVFSDAESIAVDCNGVAFLCFTTLNTIGKLGSHGSNIEVFTHLSVRENGMDLYAFADKQELNAFKMLIGVKGVGPKSANGILSHITPEQLAFSVAADDYKSLSAAPGVGAKTAQRIVLELKDKVSNDDIKNSISKSPSISMGAGNINEAITALVALGYSQGQAASALAGLVDADNTVQDLIKVALRVLAQK